MWHYWDLQEIYLDLPTVTNVCFFTPKTSQARQTFGIVGRSTGHHLRLCQQTPPEETCRVGCWYRYTITNATDGTARTECRVVPSMGRHMWQSHGVYGYRYTVALRALMMWVSTEELLELFRWPGLRGLLQEARRLGGGKIPGVGSNPHSGKVVGGCQGGSNYSGWLEGGPTDFRRYQELNAARMAENIDATCAAHDRWHKQISRAFLMALRLRALPWSLARIQAVEAAEGRPSNEPCNELGCFCGKDLHFQVKGICIKAFKHSPPKMTSRQVDCVCSLQFQFL